MRVIALALLASLPVGMLVFVVGEVLNSPTVAHVGGWLTLPATLGFALLLVAIVLGKLATAVLSAASALRRAMRR